MNSVVDVAIIGAGPYGLSIAAHLGRLGIDYRIFGPPMDTWRRHMPRGMRLKSEGFASSLYDPGSTFPLARYCAERGIPYADLGLPVRLETFTDYGLEFQKRLVPHLEDTNVSRLDETRAGFEISLENGRSLVARRVVMAVGITHFAALPPVLSRLPEQLMTHASRHSAMDSFAGRHVVVVGAGASAADTAALLLEAGASVQIVARKPVFRFHHPPGKIPRPVLERIRFPMTGLGPGWRSLFCTSAPLVFHRMPERFRLEVARRHLGPAAGWFVKDQLVGKVPFHLGVSLRDATVQNGRVHLQIAGAKGATTLVADHVIAATGYKVDLGRVPFLTSDLRAAIKCVEQAPVLTPSFESSVPGLYFVGISSLNSFGPLVRFAYGAKFTARRLSRQLARSARRSLVQGAPAEGPQESVLQSRSISQ